MKPPGLTAVTVAMAVLNLTGFMTTGDTGAFGYFIASVIVGVSYVVLWYFWQGRNWARWLVVVASVMALINLAFVALMPWPLRVVVITEALLGLFLLFWLNTKTVRAFFIAGRA